MANGRTRLELTWIGKDERPRLEPRILLEDPERSFLASADAPRQPSAHMVVEGDNLLALKALEQAYGGQVKCIYIDPPYNTGSAFFTYDDGIEHSLWLSLMRERLEILWRLLTPDNGVLLISINDDECHYLKVLCDELFGRSSFVTSLVWNYEGNTDNQAKIINYHEYILVYSRSGQVDDPQVIDPNVPTSSKLYRPEIRNTIVKNGPKNPVKPVLIPAGFPAGFESGVVERHAVDWPKYDQDVQVAGGRTVSPVTARSGWSSRKILEKFIHGGCTPVLDSKGQSTTDPFQHDVQVAGVTGETDYLPEYLASSLVLRGFTLIQNSCPCTGTSSHLVTRFLSQRLEPVVTSQHCAA